MSKRVLVIGLFVAAISVLAVFVLLFFTRFSHFKMSDYRLCADGGWRKLEFSCNVPESERGEVIVSFDECVKAGNAIMESYPRRCRVDDLVFTEDIGNELEKSDLIKIFTPRPNETVSSPLKVEGEARGYWFFEASFPIFLKDAAGNTLATAVAQAKSDWMTEEFVSFSAEIDFVSSSTKLFLVLKKDNPSGLSEYDDELVVPIVIEPQEIATVKVYFANSKFDPNVSDCGKTYPVEREVIKTPAIARAALSELLAGVNEKEESEDYFTSINSGVSINSLKIEEGTAYVDFDAQMERELGGSCRVSSIRSQISETLKQFSSVKEVVISVEGRIDDALQP